MSLLKMLQLDPPKAKYAGPAASDRDDAFEAEKAKWRGKLKELTCWAKASLTARSRPS